MLDRFLTTPCFSDVVISLEIDELLESILLGEPVDHAFTMFPGAPRKIDGGAAVQRSVLAVRHHVKPPGHAVKLRRSSSNSQPHNPRARTCSGHPRLHSTLQTKTWVAGINPATGTWSNDDAQHRRYVIASSAKTASSSVERSFFLVS